MYNECSSWSLGVCELVFLSLSSLSEAKLHVLVMGAICHLQSNLSFDWKEPNDLAKRKMPNRS